MLFSLIPGDSLKDNKLRLAFFDSGVGGISILEEVLAHAPSCEVVYVADSAKYPYGSLAESEIISRVTTIARELYKSFPFDCFIVACNTASTAVLPSLRTYFPDSVVGVVPAIKPAAEMSKSGVIGLLATPGTIVRPYTDELIARFAPNMTVIRIGSTRLVEIAEIKMRTGTVDKGSIEEELKPFLSRPELDVVVLACTHFPLLRDELQNVLGPGISLVSSGQAVSKRVWSLLQNNLPPGGPIAIMYISTSNQGAHEEIWSYLSKWGVVTHQVQGFGL
jgi:glutamate racemase